MKSLCLKCRKDSENINLRIQIPATVKQWYYRSIKNMKVKISRFTKNLEAKKD